MQPESKRVFAPGAWSETRNFAHNTPASSMPARPARPAIWWYLQYAKGQLEVVKHPDSGFLKVTCKHFGGR